MAETFNFLLLHQFFEVTVNYYARTFFAQFKEHFLLFLLGEFLGLTSFIPIEAHDMGLRGCCFLVFALLFPLLSLKFILFCPVSLFLQLFCLTFWLFVLIVLLLRIVVWILLLEWLACRFVHYLMKFNEIIKGKVPEPQLK